MYARLLPASALVDDCCATLLQDSYPKCSLVIKIRLAGAYVMYKITFKHGHDISSSLRIFLEGLSGVTVIGAWYEAVGSSCLLNGESCFAIVLIFSPLPLASRTGIVRA